MKKFISKTLLVFFFLLTLCITVSYATAGTVSYTYDGVGRLTNVAYDDGSTITYIYDFAGNLLQRVITVELTLADAILSLKALASVAAPSTVFKEGDVNEDGKIGLEEVVYILQKVSELR